MVSLHGTAPHEQSDLNIIKCLPRIEVVAYPSFERTAIKQDPITSDPENYQYVLKAGSTAWYVAEGTIQFPAFSQREHPLAFRTSKYLRQEWYLALGEGGERVAGPAQDLVIKHFLQRRGFAESRLPWSLVEVIAHNIGNHFFNDNDESYQQQRGSRYLQSMIVEGKTLAEKEYQSILEEQVRNNPVSPILPRTYTYSLEKDLANYSHP